MATTALQDGGSGAGGQAAAGMVWSLIMMSSCSATSNQCSRSCSVLASAAGSAGRGEKFQLISSSKSARSNLFFAPIARVRRVVFQKHMTRQFVPSYGRERAVQTLRSKTGVQAMNGLHQVMNEFHQVMNEFHRNIGGSRTFRKHRSRRFPKTYGAW